MRLHPDPEKMEVLYPGNLALLSMFLKNPENSNQSALKKDGKKKEGGECADVLTCGMCQKDFLLADILRFIQHKVTCQTPPPSSGVCRTEGSISPSENEDSPPRTHTGRPGSKEYNGDLNHFNVDPASSSPKNLSVDGDDYKSEEKRKREDDDDILASVRKKPRSTQDAEANTVDSEPTRHMCGTCGTVLGSAWSLVQHVQSSHGIIIYQEAPGAVPSTSTPSTPPALPRPSHSSPLSSVSSTAPTVTIPSHHMSLPLLDPTKVDLTKVDLTKVDLSKMDLSKMSSTPLPPHPPVTAPLLDPNHPFNLLRMPIDGRPPFPPGLAPPFIRPGHDFRMDQILQEGLRLNPGLIPHHFERPPFLDPGLGAPRPSAPTPLSSGGDPNLDFYSQRLRQLAGTTSPTSSTSPRKPLPTPPPTFSSPNGPTPSTPVAPQTPTSTKVGTPGSNEKPYKCETCSKVFKWETNLMIHQRVHTGEKEFRCYKCQEVLSSAQQLRSHMKTHRKASSQNGASPDSSRPATEDDNEDMEEEEMEAEEEEDIEEEEAEEEEVDSNPSGTDSLDDEEEEIHPDDMYNDGPEDLSTSKASSTPTSQNVTSSTVNDSKSRHNRPDHQKSVVGELMDKFGLSNISAYSEAYHQALKESGRLMGIHGNKGSAPHNGLEKTLKLRDDLAKGLISKHPSIDLAHQTLLGAFDNPYDPQNRLGNHREGNSLYAGLWLPSLTGSPGAPRDLFPHIPHSEANLFQHKLISDNAIKTESPQSITKPGVSSAPGTPLSLIHQTKKESKRNDTCEYCGKIFKNCSNLTVHRRSHTGEKPYKCDLCSYACAQSSKLTRHMKTHGRLGKDVYRCRFCDMPFSVASTLEKHMRKCVVNQNSKGLFPPISAANQDGLDSYKGLHFTSSIMNEDSKPSVLFSSHFNAAGNVSANTSTDDSKPNSLFSSHFTTSAMSGNSTTEDTGDSSNLSGPGS